MKGFKQTLALTLVIWGIIADYASALITIDTVPVGNAGNPNAYSGFGAVSYEYGIGKYEVTLNQYTVFLNAVGATDRYSLYNANMAADPHIAGIARSGLSGSYTYSVIGSGNRPVTYVSWFDAARFVNWMHNGQPAGAQAAGTTETGAYTLNGALSRSFTRNADWKYGLPSENEWFKAAYYDPTIPLVTKYWLYPTATHSIPNSRNGSESDANAANFFREDGIANGFNGGFAVNNSTSYPTGNALTDAGAFSLADSFYGTFDQAGNVAEWNDADSGFSHRVQGGSWLNGAEYLRPTVRSYFGPGRESFDVGFRVAIVPEPSVVGLMGLGLAMLAWQQKRTL